MGILLGVSACIHACIHILLVLRLLTKYAYLRNVCMAMKFARATRVIVCAVPESYLIGRGTWWCAATLDRPGSEMPPVHGGRGTRCCACSGCGSIQEIRHELAQASLEVCMRRIT